MQVIGNDALIAPEGYTVLPLELHEMMTNSAKHGSLSDSRGHLESSEKVAERLSSREVPFWFITGYLDAIEKRAESHPRYPVGAPARTITGLPHPRACRPSARRPWR